MAAPDRRADAADLGRGGPDRAACLRRGVLGADPGLAPHRAAECRARPVRRTEGRLSRRLLRTRRAESRTPRDRLPAGLIQRVLIHGGIAQEAGTTGIAGNFAAFIG